MRPLPGGELPLRVADEAAGPVIRCLCGTEAAIMSPGRMAADVSPAALLRMILHARQCKRGRNEQLEQDRLTGARR